MKNPRSVFRACAVIAALSVLAWRLLAHLQPSSLIDQAPGFALPLTGVGLFFVMAGLAVFWIRPGSGASLFLVYALCSGVHWGGAVGAVSSGAERSLLLLYIGLSVAGEAALMHLAIVYRRSGGLARWAAALIYLPAIGGLSLAPIAGRLPDESLSAVAGILLLLGTLFGVVAGVTFIVHWFRAGRQHRREQRLGIVVLCLLLAGVPSLFASSGLLPGPSDLYNLLSILLPAGLGYALTTRPV